MLRRHRRSPVRVPIAVPLVVWLLELGGCASLTREAAVPLPPPALLSAAALELPTDCEPASGTVYRTSYVVGTDGRVADAASPAGDGCVERALRAWVATFRYEPIDASMPAVIDWIAVTASRGG
jgi:hypothetical protein